MKRKKFPIWIILILVLLLIIVGVIFLIKNVNEKEKNTGDIIIKDNVHILEDGDDLEDELTNVSENQLIFNENPKYKEGEIIVAGIIDEAEEGFIRKVIKTNKEDDRYVVETEPAFLTDVFEKAYIEKTIKLTEDGAEEANLDELQTKVMSDSGKLQRVSSNKANGEDTYSVMNLSDEESKETDARYLFNISFDENIDNIVTVSGEAGFNIWLELKMDVEEGEIVFGIVAHNQVGTMLSARCSEELNREVEKVISRKVLPKYQFNVSGIPIVLTNEIEAVLGAEGEIEGAISTDFEVFSENSYGFVYDSRKGKVSEIKEDKSDTSGLDWNVPLQMTGNGVAGVSLHLVTKLYGCTGVDMGIGVQGEASGEVKLSSNPNLDLYAGKLDLSIAPKVEGELVVEIPVIDEELVEQSLFEKELKPFWEKEWKSSNDWKGDLEWTGTGEKGKSYITRYGEANMISAPTFQFNVPRGWDITTEEVDTDMTKVFDEHVVISNERGATVSYYDCKGRIGGVSRTMLKGNITKVADSEFVPSYPTGTNTDFSSLGKFCVAKIKIIGEMFMDTDVDYQTIDGATFYAVIPESYLGEREFVGQVGYIDEFSFEYPTPHAFIAEAPEGKFAKNEEEEVIEILKSFKIAEQ